MIERDRLLLARVAETNRGIPATVIAMQEKQDGGELPAGLLRELGHQLSALGADLLARAAERDGATVQRVIVDARPDSS